jgi:hypothetical protein
VSAPVKKYIVDLVSQTRQNDDLYLGASPRGSLAFLKADGDLPLLGCVSMQAKYLPMSSGGILVTPSVNKDLLIAVEIAVEDLTRRNLHPMVVMIMANSFGGPSGGEEIIVGLKRRNVPVFKIECGENLEKQLGQIPVIYKRTWSSI